MTDEAHSKGASAPKKEHTEVISGEGKVRSPEWIVTPGLFRPVYSFIALISLIST